MTVNQLARIFGVVAVIATGGDVMREAMAAEPSAGSALTVDQAVAIAVRDNPNLAEMQARYEALSEIPSQVGSLPDPVVSFGTMNFPTDTFDRSQEPMTQLQFGVSQQFPFPGKLGLKEEAAEYDAIAAARSVDEVRLQLIRNVRTKWWQTLYLDRALDTVRSNKALLRQFITVAKTKYETGTGLQQDVLLAQLELSKLMDQEIEVTAMRETEAIRLNVLMDRLPGVAVHLPEDAPTGMPDLRPEASLLAQAEASRPLLSQRETQIDAAHSRLDLAEREYYPDFMVGMTYGARTGDNPPFTGGTRADFLSLMLSARIPLYADRKQSKGVAQRVRELKSKEYALQDEKGQIRQEIASAVTDYERARKQNQLFVSGIIPQARQTVQSMLSGYQVSEVDFLNLVRSQVTLFNYELRYWKTLVEAKVALAALAAAVGEDAIHE